MEKRIQVNHEVMKSNISTTKEIGKQQKHTHKSEGMMKREGVRKKNRAYRNSSVCVTVLNCQQHVCTDLYGARITAMTMGVICL